MKTDYYIDKFQPNYFVIDSFEQLFNETFKDFKPIYEEMVEIEKYPIGKISESDEIYSFKQPGT